MKYLCRLLGLAIGLVGSPLLAGEAVKIEVQCSALSSEEIAEVKVRLGLQERAGLVQQLVLSCPFSEPVGELYDHEGQLLWRSRAEGRSSGPVATLKEELILLGMEVLEWVPEGTRGAPSEPGRTQATPSADSPTATSPKQVDAPRDEWSAVQSPYEGAEVRGPWSFALAGLLGSREFRSPLLAGAHFRLEREVFDRWFAGLTAEVYLPLENEAGFSLRRAQWAAAWGGREDWFEGRLLFGLSSVLLNNELTAPSDVVFSSPMFGAEVAVVAFRGSLSSRYFLRLDFAPVSPEVNVDGALQLVPPRYFLTMGLGGALFFGR